MLGKDFYDIPIRKGDVVTWVGSNDSNCKLSAFYGMKFRVTGLNGPFLEVDYELISGLYYPVRFVKIKSKLSLEKL